MARGLQIPYKEFISSGTGPGASPVGAFSMRASKFTRIFDVAWLSGGIAVYQLLGYPTLDSSNPINPLINRYLPQQDADFPWMVATNILSVTGIGQRGSYIANGLRAAQYDKARIVVEFSMPDYDILEDDYTENEFERFVTFCTKPAAEYLSVPQTGTLKWSDGPNVGRDFPGNVGFVVGNIDMTWNWLQIPYEAIPFDTVQDTIGRVNKYDWELFPGGPTAAAGTLLLTSWEPVRYNSPFGARTWDVNYTARYNPRLHNNFYDFNKGSYALSPFLQASVDGNFYAPGSVPDGKLLYDERDFFDLFRPPVP
jgi:hypothetical protein